ncbi:3'-5' exonuclease [Coemansia sp. RSA 2559]|nr:3'-5' exonuclease [Coemansia sp. RSA 2559]KAJ2867899.1 3'-5' exonuclease [Coemansia erecta]
MTRDKTTRKRGRRDDEEEQSDSEGDIVLPIDSLISKKKHNSRTDDVDDLVGALLGDEPEAAAKKRKAKRQRTKEASRKSRAATAAMEAEQLELEQIEYDDDDVADLYAWDNKDDAPPAKSQKTTVYKDGSLEEEDEEEEEKLRAERQRILQLAMAAADDTTNNDDMPRNEDDWFAKLDEEVHERNNGTFDDSDDDMATDIVGKPASSMPHRAVVPQHKREATGKFLAIDCEMVGAGFKGSRSMLARVSVVNYYGHVIIDAFVTPLEPVTDYRTWVSGIRKQDLDRHGRPFGEVQKEVAELIKDRILVGHAIKHDLKALLLTHPGSMIRDTARYQGFRSMFPTSKGSMFSLRKLAASLLNITIQESEHSSVTDAKTTMLLYRKVKDEWEKALAPKRYKTQIKKIRTKERFDQLRSERKELRDQQAVQQKKARHNPFQMPRLKE